MSDPNPTWAGLLQASLDHWSQGQSELGGKGLQKVLGQLRGHDHTLWRALVHNQLALLSQQMGHADYARQQWELACQSWADSGLEGGSPELQATLDWYVQLLTRYGFVGRAERIQQLHQSLQPPLLEPGLESPPGEDLYAETYAPLGGQRLSAPQSAPAAPEVALSWDGYVEEALRLASEGKLPPALVCLDRAKDSALKMPEREHLLALLYNAESLACFVAGDYSAAAQAKQESVRLWTALGETGKVFMSDVHPRFIQALEGSQQSQAATVFGQRHGRRECPLIDPWSDLEVGLQTGDWQNSAFDLSRDWKLRVESSLRYHGRGSYVEAQRELGLLEQQMQPEDLRKLPGALLYQMQSVMAYAMGDYDSAQELYRKAVGVWERLEPPQRKEGFFLDQLRNLVTMYGLESMTERLGEGLCDPFVFYKHEHQMEKVAVGEDVDEQSDPREQWEKQLLEAWQMAAKGRWDMARRRAAHSERVARLLGHDDLRIAYSLNSQGLFAHSAGDYQDADQFYEEAVRAWRRGSHMPAARTAYSEFCDLLRQSDWEHLAALLESLWDQPVSRSAFNPALLPLDSLEALGMQVHQAVEDDEEDDGVLRLPSMPRKAPAPTRGGNGRGLGLVVLLLVASLVGVGWWWLHRQPVSPPTPAVTPKA